MDKQLVENVVTQVLDEMRARPIPLGISNRHIHLSPEDFERLFPGQTVTIKKALLQPGYFAAEQTVTLVGPKGQLKNVRLLGRYAAPARSRFHVRMPVRWVSPPRCACPAIWRVHQGSGW
jgi:propanediol utilization protein